MAKSIEKLTSDQEKILYRQIGKFCAFRERAEYEVHQKLLSLDVSEKLIYTFIQLLKEDKFLDDKRFARYYAQGKFLNNHWGKIKIRTNLYELKIKHEYIQDAFAKISDEDYEATIQKLIEKKAAITKEKDVYLKRKKIVDFLRVKGFEAEIAWDMVKKNFT